MGKEKENREKLQLSTFYGKLYFIVSIVVLALAVLFIVLVFVYKMLGFVYATAGVGLAYCIFLLTAEILRTKKKKTASSIAPQVQDKNLYEYTDTITKMVVCDYLCSKYDRMESVHRPNYTNPAPGLKSGLLLADTHYVSYKKERKCFMYVYQDENKQVKILLKTTKEHFEKIKEAHPSAEPSNFPKVRKGDAYYKLVIDSSYSREQLFAILDEALENFLKGIYA